MTGLSKPALTLAFAGPLMAAGIYIAGGQTLVWAGVGVVVAAVFGAMALALDIAIKEDGR